MSGRSRTNRRARLRRSGEGSQELQTVAEWVVGVEAVESRQQLIVHDLNPGGFKTLTKRGQVIGE